MPDTSELKVKFSKFADEVSAETGRLIADKISSLQRAVEDVVKSSHVVSAPAEAQLDLKDLKTTSYALKKAQGQNEIISSILTFAGKCVQRAAVFALKGKSLYGWQAIGLKADSPSVINPIKNIVIDTAKPSPFADVMKNCKPWIGKSASSPVMDELFGKLGGPAPKEMCIFPLTINERIIAVLYGDNITGSQILFQTDSLEVMAVVASLVMETISLQRAKGPGAADEKKDEEEGATKPVKPAPIPEEMDEATKKLHEKAKRTARVIVGDIALYNKAKIEQGLKSGRLGDLLRDDITKGRELYHQRVAPEISRTSNYFEDTLIEVIAKGDRKALGL